MNQWQSHWLNSVENNGPTRQHCVQNDKKQHSDKYTQTGGAVYEDFPLMLTMLEYKNYLQFGAVICCISAERAKVRA